MYLKHREKTENPPVRIYVNKIENMITFKIKTVYYVELLMPEITKDENSEKTDNPPVRIYVKMKIVKTYLVLKLLK